MLRRQGERKPYWDPDTGLPGWCLGSEAFRKVLLAQMSEGKGPEHYSQEMRKSAQEKDARVTRQELKRAGWVESDFGRRRKGDPIKLKIALRLGQETTMTLAWIAQRLRMEPKRSFRICRRDRKGVKSRNAS